MKSEDREMLDFLRTVDSSFQYKNRRLRFMRLASVSREILNLRRGFDGLWVKARGGYMIDAAGISPESAALLTGIFGKPDEARIILEADRMIAALDRDRFREFLARSVRKDGARDNLYRIFFGFGTSLHHLASLRIPYLERYLPTAAHAGGDLAAARFSADDIVNIRGIIDDFDLIRDNLAADVRLYRDFIRDFKNLYRVDAGLRVIGYGEISTVMDVNKGYFLNEDFELSRIDSTRWIWKKMPPFQNTEQVRAYEKLYREYRDILVDDVGITVPRQMMAYFEHLGRCNVYAGQERADPAMIGNTLVRAIGGDDANRLFELVLLEIRKVHRFNSLGGDVIVGLDGQLSNWVLVQATPGKITTDDSLLYIDTSSPLYRVKGREQLDTGIFLKNAPSFLRLIIRIFFLKEVVNRYYDMRSVIIDLIANLHKEKRSDLIDAFIARANAFLAETEIPGGTITRKEIDKYYADDAFIWRFFQFSRRVDKFIIEKLLRRKYHYRLPDKIER